MIRVGTLMLARTVFAILAGISLAKAFKDPPDRILEPYLHVILGVVLLGLAVYAHMASRRIEADS